MSADLPIVDRKHLSSMTGGDIDLAVEVIDIFKHQAEMWQRMLDPKLPPQQWADAAHTLKGSSLGVGALRLAKACEVAETLGRSDDISLARAAVTLGDVKDEIIVALEEAARVAHDLSLTKSF